MTIILDERQRIVGVILPDGSEISVFRIEVGEYQTTRVVGHPVYKTDGGDERVDPGTSYSVELVGGENTIEKRAKSGH
jgi:hypothetical protein